MRNTIISAYRISPKKKEWKNSDGTFADKENKQHNLQNIQFVDHFIQIVITKASLNIVTVSK